MRVGGYARVSTAEQAQGEARSIDQQLAEIKALCERMDWTLVETFVDCEDYRATQTPNKGRVVNPSGERADRPEFLRMLERLKTGELDAVACWRDDRLVRHPRVAVALEDALDLGDARRNGRGKIEIFDATGGRIDRFTLSIKATIWREENKRRAERTRMGKIATLQEGRWPGPYERLGYTSIAEPGKRGRGIILVPEEAELVQQIFNWYDVGLPLAEVRRKLIASGANQKGESHRKHNWAQSVIFKVVTCPDYMGAATWDFGDGERVSIEIPRIIEPEQWERVQERMEGNKQLATRNSRGVYLLQGLAECGECGGSISVTAQRYWYWTLADGTKIRQTRDVMGHTYRCLPAALYRGDEPHPAPYHWNGPDLDWAVWRHLVDKGISQPDLLKLQIIARQEELQKQGESVDSEIAHARRRLSEVDGERAFYQRQAARGMITELEFDARMAETEEAARYWQGEIKRLTELRDDVEKVEAGLAYIDSLTSNLRERLPKIDLEPDELDALPEERRREILEERRTIIRALCQKVKVWADGGVRVIGALDGTEGERFDLTGTPIRPASAPRGSGTPARPARRAATAALLSCAARRATPRPPSRPGRDAG
ncbi:MAG: recombinase family protein [Anaerolineae bacterium]|nr:recombinase family protein [Anaerolineae bacterium]